jgi:hypothetical protein
MRALVSAAGRQRTAAPDHFPQRIARRRLLRISRTDRRALLRSVAERMSLVALRQQIDALVAPPRADGVAISTGIAALDRALSDGGLPCGRLTEIGGQRGSGKTTLVRQLVAGAVESGRWVAYVDGTRTLAARDWVAIGGSRRLWIIRPPQTERSAWCADVLLRSGAFGLVVLDAGRPVLSRQIAIRLTRLAQDHDAALVVVSEGHAGAVVGSAVRLRVTRMSADGRTAVPKGQPEGSIVGTWRNERWRRTAEDREPRGGVVAGRALQVVVEKGGRHQSVEVNCAIDVARRLCAHSEVPDRRGVAPRNRRGERATPDTPGARRPDGAGTTHSASVLPRKRRCAEPLVRHDGFLLAGGCRR